MYINGPTPHDVWFTVSFDQPEAFLGLSKLSCHSFGWGSLFSILAVCDPTYLPNVQTLFTNPRKLLSSPSHGERDVFCNKSDVSVFSRAGIAGTGSWPSGMHSIQSAAHAVWHLYSKHTEGALAGPAASSDCLCQARWPLAAVWYFGISGASQTLRKWMRWYGKKKKSFNNFSSLFYASCHGDKWTSLVSIRRCSNVSNLFSWQYWVGKSGAPISVIKCQSHHSMASHDGNVWQQRRTGCLSRLMQCKWADLTMLVSVQTNALAAGICVTSKDTCLMAGDKSTGCIPEQFCRHAV